MRLKRIPTGSTLGPVAKLPAGEFRPPPADCSEREFTALVIAFAQVHGWRVAHFRPAKTAKGWRTAVQGDGAGFPDLLMLRGGQLYVAELKVGRNTLTPSQRAWLNDFCDVDGDVHAYAWHPQDWSQIVRVLT